MSAPTTDGRRPAWDEVQERQRRDKARVDAEHAAAVEASPARPMDTWRVCGEPLADGPGGGCSCHPGGPFPEQVRSALVRLAAGGGPS